MHTLNELYKLHVRPHLDYGDVIYHIPSKRQICFNTADHAHFASALEQNALERGYGPKLGGRGLFASIALISSLSFQTTRDILFQRLSTCHDGEGEAFLWTSTSGNHFLYQLDPYRNSWKSLEKSKGQIRLYARAEASWIQGELIT